MKDNAFTFFPGKGIYTTPNSGLDPVLEVYDKEKAERIFSAFSHILVFKDKDLLSDKFTKEEIDSAYTLYELHGDVSEINKTPLSDESSLSFEGIINSKDTRISIGENKVEWDLLRKELHSKGYSLKKREYLSGELDELVPVYMVVNEETGVISEGKGFTDEQAQYSAIAEAIERLYAYPAEPEKLHISSQESLFKDKNTKLNILSGPRDTFSPDIFTEWLPAINVLNNENVFLPAEISYFKYISQSIKLKLFSLYHTTGLATGASIEEGILSALFEIMERDAYWITMRCKINHPDIDLTHISDLNPKVTEVIEILKRNGFEIYLKDMSLDWSVPIAHAVLVDTHKRIPCYSHGSGAGFTWSTAIARAVAEVVQMHSGMSDFTRVPDNWERIVSAGDVLGRGELAWSDPLFSLHIQHLITKSDKTFVREVNINTPTDLLNLFKEKKYTVIAVPLNNIHGLNVVRVYIPEATQPDERLERITERMEKFRKENNLPGFFTDPILT